MLYVNIMIIMPPVWLLLSMLPLFQIFIIDYNYVCSLVGLNISYYHNTWSEMRYA